MKYQGFLLAVLALVPFTSSHATPRAAVRPHPVTLVCGAEDPEAAGAAKLGDVEFAGIVPGRGLAPEDFAGDGLVIVADPSLYRITDDPVGVLRRAADNWEIPGTYIKFQVVDHPVERGGNVVHAEPTNAAARATVGRPGWGRDGYLTMRLDEPFSRGDDSLVAIVTHELGHWLGFDHSFLGSTVMFPVLTDRINWVDPDQTAKALARYASGPNALGEVRGVVTRAGSPLSGARVNLLGSDARTAFGTFAGSDGAYHLPVFAGTYRVVVDPNDGPAVDGNFIGIYPGGPLDFVTLEVPGQLVVSAGQTTAADFDVPAGGDYRFRITTDEPTVCGPGGGAQGVTIYYEGAAPDEIAGVESLSPDVHIYSVLDRGGEIDVFCDVDRDALLGPRAFRLRKTNGATAIVTGIVGVVAPYWLNAPSYTLEAGAGAPLEISWTNLVPRDEATATELSVSVDGGAAWQQLARLDARQTSFVWQPDPGLVTSALRFRIRALDAVESQLAIDESVFNIGLGRPARGGATGGADTTAPAVRVTSPNGGETLAGGEAARVAWEADDDVAVASQEVEVSVDGGARWTSLGEVPATARSLEWTPTAKVSDAVLVRVTARDNAGNAASDASDAAARVRLRPSVSRVTAKTKGAEVALKIKGANLAAGAVVRINGEAVGVAVSFSRGALKLRGDAAALGLAPSGATNAVVVEVDGLASAEAAFMSP